MRMLLIEDDKKVAAFVKKGLKEEGFAVDTAYDGEEGLYLAQINEYDAVILDIMLPKKDGITVCSELRKQGNTTPIIMLTAKGSTEDRIKGLNEGADDYLAKPFSFEELLARVRALIRRGQQDKGKTLKVDDLEFNPVTREVVRGGKKIELTGREFALLEYFMRNKNRVLSETMIIEHVWDMDYDPGTNVVDVYIYHIRQKIDRGFRKKLIHTVRGLGYIMKES